MGSERVGMVTTRFDILLVKLDPTIGSEIQKTRPCVVISPDELNRPLATLVIAPMTTRGKIYRSRVACAFDGKPGYIALDQMRTVDKARVLKPLGRLDEETQEALLQTLAEMFAP